MNNSLKIYSGEKIDRSPLWYIMFFSISIFLIVFSFFKGGISGGISVLFIFLIILISYIILYLISLKKDVLYVEDGYIRIKNKTFHFNELLGFNVELDKEGNFTNFVIIPVQTYYPLKFTINDTQENVKKIINLLIEKKVPLYSKYENDKLYKIIKFLKLG